MRGTWTGLTYGSIAILESNLTTILSPDKTNENNFQFPIFRPRAADSLLNQLFRSTTIFRFQFYLLIQSSYLTPLKTHFHSLCSNQIWTCFKVSGVYRWSKVQYLWNQFKNSSLCGNIAPLKPFIFSGNKKTNRSAFKLMNPSNNIPLKHGSTEGQDQIPTETTIWHYLWHRTDNQASAISLQFH